MHGQGWVVSICLIAACGGKSERDRGLDFSGNDGHMLADAGGYPAPTIDPAAGGSGEDTPVTTIDASACQTRALDCPVTDYFVELEGEADVITMKYPGNPPCGKCSALGCVLVGYETSGCGIELRLSVCAGENAAPPCLELTGGMSGSYVDAAGSTWTVDVSSMPRSGQSAIGSRLIDERIELFLTNEKAEARKLTAHVRICGDVYVTGVPC